MRRTCTSGLTAGLAALVICGAAAPGAAAAGAYERVLAVYQATGTVPPCQFTTPQLLQAQKGIDTYGAQYFADFATAIATALSSRASGQCTHGAAVHPPQYRSGYLAGDQIIDTPVTAATGAGVPLPLLLTAVFALFGLVLTAVLLHRRGPGEYPPALGGRLAHLLGELEFRSAGWLSELDGRLRRPR